MTLTSTIRFAAILLALSACGLATGLVCAEELPQFEAAAKKLTDATVTVRMIALPAAPQGAEADPLAKQPNSPSRVTVCTGVAIAPKRIVTCLRYEAGSRLRVTLADGRQADAQLKVIDHFSTLAILELTELEVPAITLSPKEPASGRWVISAAGWGAAQAVQTFGMLGAVDRKIPGAELPPLLECDLRGAATAAGSGIANPDATLAGIVVAVQKPNDDAPRTYAVPSKHIERLLASEAADKVVVLQRRRPTLGLTLTAGEKAETVVVEKVEENGPAAQAGIAKGDQVLAVDGLYIRSVYQAIGPVLAKQPGDKIRLKVLQGEKLATIDVTLGGGVEFPNQIALLGPDRRLLNDPRIELARLAAKEREPRDPLAVMEAAGEDEQPVDPRDEQIEILQRAIDRYAKLIEFYQQQLDAEREKVKQLEAEK
ncbi:S1C family serine protease [Blastopirellula sp. JC732]|uniref:S1C family serine protease n=1 Tax=Blastopirellula sediminis TaxID=2894196 RepID=A0A9X1MPT8_9BACT|nr:S1C family serine protease [Blastopirellula sediminis]MCC9605582.1 S1C family serine protease [Blastopirellula sediminis]MCC9631118.1 S1C family serine protease [Blastopirellula sediminis]